MRLFNKKGDIGTVLSIIVLVSMIFFTTFNYLFIDVDSMKYQNIQQYGKDMLLYVETKSKLEKSYFVDTRTALNSKLNDGSSSLQMFVTVNNTRYDVTQMPTTLTPDFGSQLRVEIIYNYKPKRIEFVNSLIGSKEDTSLKTMGIDYKTTSKNRGTTDA